MRATSESWPRTARPRNLSFGGREASPIRSAFPTGRGPVAGDHEGKEEVLQALTTLMDLTDGTARLRAQALLADDTYGMALVESTVSRRQWTHTSLMVQVFRIAGSQIAELWSYPGDPYGDDAFLSS